MQAVAHLCSLAAPETAAVLAGAADHLREQISARPHPADGVVNGDHLARVRQRIGYARCAAAWAEGREAALESIVALALVTAGPGDR